MRHAASDRSTETLEASFKLLVDRGVLATAVARDARIACTSPKFDDIFGIASGAAVGLPVLELCADADRERVARALATAASEPADAAEPGYVKLGFDARRADGSVFEAEVVVTAGELADGPATVLIVTDAGERRRAEAQLGYLAFLDPLTGLPNRALFFDRLRETLAAARGDGRLFAVMLCHLDGLEEARAALGDEVANEMLKEVARRVERTVRVSDTVARHREHELGVLLARIARRTDAALIGERMVRALADPVEVEGRARRLGIHVGVATFPADGADLDALLGRAASALAASRRASESPIAFAERPAGAAAPTHLPFLRWTEAHAVGVPVVDAQHRTMVTLINRLGEDLSAHRGRDAVLASLCALVSFTEKHFATEELLMAEHPGWSLERAHVREHRQLVEDLTGLGLEVEDAAIPVTLRFLQDWLQSHIEGMDKQMGVWLREHGAS